MIFLRFQVDQRKWYLSFPQPEKNCQQNLTSKDAHPCFSCTHHNHGEYIAVCKGIHLTLNVTEYCCLPLRDSKVKKPCCHLMEDERTYPDTETKCMSHQHHILVFALTRPWNGRPTLTKLQVKQIPLWASFRGT